MALIAGGTSTGGNASGILFSLDCSLFSFGTDAIGEGYRRGKSANFSQTPVIGAQSPFISFANSAPIEISLEIGLIAESPGNQNDITDLLDSFLALICPIENGIQPPSICTINLSGTIIQNFSCLLTDCHQVMAKERMWNINTGEPMDAVVSLTFIELALNSVDAKDWVPSRGKQYLYGATAS